MMKLKNKEAKYWNKKGYNALIKKSEFSPSFNSYQISILEKMKLDKKNILEIGPGLGHDLKYFAKRQCNLNALDISPNVISNLQINLKGNFIVGDVRNLATLFAKQKFDFIYARWSLVHLSYQEFKTFLKEASKLLTTDGKIFSSLRFGSDLEAHNFYTKLGSLELNKDNLKKALPSKLKIEWYQIIEFNNSKGKNDYQFSFILALKN